MPDNPIAKGSRIDCFGYTGYERKEPQIRAGNEIYELQHCEFLQCYKKMLIFQIPVFERSVNTHSEYSMVNI